MEAIGLDCDVESEVDFQIVDAIHGLREREREHMYDVSRTFNEMPYMCVSYSLMGIWAGGCWYLCSFAHILKWAKMINTIYS